MTRIATLTPRAYRACTVCPATVYSPDMGITATEAAIAAALQAVTAASPRCGTAKVVAIDGPSGAGKTDFAAALAGRLPEARILHMDDMYPGWDGLQQAVDDLYHQVLAPIALGEQAAYRRWDWDHDRHAEWQRLPGTNLLLVEGVGSGAGPGRQLESVLIWLEAGQDVRFRRCIERDGESYLAHWRRWARAEEALFARDGTRSGADLVINTSPSAVADR